MTKVTINSDLPAKLRDSVEMLELCDERGNTLGFFHPFRVSEAGTMPQLSEEEIEERRREPGGRPLSEILKDLKAQYPLQ